MTTDPITLRASDLMRLRGLTQSQAYAQAAHELGVCPVTEHVSVRLTADQRIKAAALGGTAGMGAGIRAALDAAKLPGE